MSKRVETAFTNVALGTATVEDRNIVETYLRVMSRIR